MQEIIITFLLIALSYVVYSIWIKPNNNMKLYAKKLKQQGYNVLYIPYNPIKNNMISALAQGTSRGDAMKVYKERGQQGYDVVVTNLLYKPMLQFIHPDFIKDYYSVDKHYSYPKQQKVADIFSRAAGNGLPFSQGLNWKRKRNILNKVFNFDFVKSQTKNIAQACDKALKQVESTGLKNTQQNSVSYNVLDLTVSMFSKVMMMSFLGGTDKQTIMGQPAGKFLKRLISDLSEQSFVLINFILGVRYLKLGITKQQKQIQERVKIYRGWGNYFIKKRILQINQKLDNAKQKHQASDLIQALLIAQRNAYKQKSDEQTMGNQQQIFQQFNAFFIAGTDTTSNFTQMMIYSIGKDQKIQAKVRQEINQYMINDDYSYQNLKNLKYIDLLQKQTTRYYGPGTHLFQRSAKQDNYINNLAIKKGTAISIMAFSNHFSEKYFKNPQEFRPERWQSQCDSIPAFVTGGFSAGARTCIGKHLAMIQSKIALVKFMKRYNKIILPKKDFIMNFKFLYGPEDFDTKLIINQKSLLN